MNMRFKKTMIGLLILLITIPLVSAFGVTSSFWDTRPLQLNPGDSERVELFLQNMVGGEDITLRAEIEEGSEFAELVDDSLDYLVPFGTKGCPCELASQYP